MRKHSRVILLAEEQLIFGRSLPEMVHARRIAEVVPQRCRHAVDDGRMRWRGGVVVQIYALHGSVMRVNRRNGTQNRPVAGSRPRRPRTS